jgi:hypothetical protein
MIRVAVVGRSIEDLEHILWLGSQGFKHVAGWVWEVTEIVSTEPIELSMEDVIDLFSKYQNDISGVVTTISGIEVELLPPHDDSEGAE